MTEKNTLEQKLDRLEEILSGYGQMLVALGRRGQHFPYGFRIQAMGR